MSGSTIRGPWGPPPTSALNVPDSDVIHRTAAELGRCFGLLISLSVRKELARVQLRTERRKDPQPPPSSPPATPAAAQVKEFYTRREFAERTGYSLRTVERMIAGGTLRLSGPNGNRIARFELERVMALKVDRGGNGVASEVERLLRKV